MIEYRRVRERWNVKFRGVMRREGRHRVTCKSEERWYENRESR